jgi:tryptophan synthase beta chain
VVGVTAGQATLKEAINEAMRDWVTNVRNTHYILGSALGFASLPDDGARFSPLHRRRSSRQILDAKAGCQSARGVRRRRQQCDRAFLALPRRLRSEMVGIEAGGRGIPHG